MNYIAVDDETVAREVLVHSIAQLDPAAGVATFPHATEAIAFAKENPVDVALLDIQLGKGTNGIALAKTLKEINPRTRICFCTGYTQYALEAWDIMAQGYLMKPITTEKLRRVLGENLPAPAAPAHPLRVQTFGNFTVFVDERPFAFPRRQCMEIFAYLVHKHGSVVTTKELAGILYENQEYTKSIRNQMSVYITELQKALRSAGLSEVVVRSGSDIAVQPAEISCDVYDFMRGDLAAMNQYIGEYMAQYSWAEGFETLLTEKTTK